MKKTAIRVVASVIPPWLRTRSAGDRSIEFSQTSLRYWASGVSAKWQIAAATTAHKDGGSTMMMPAASPGIPVKSESVPLVCVFDIRIKINWKAGDKYTYIDAGYVYSSTFINHNSAVRAHGKDQQIRKTPASPPTHKLDRGPRAPAMSSHQSPAIPSLGNTFGALFVGATIAAITETANDLQIEAMTITIHSVSTIWQETRRLKRGLRKYGLLAATVSHPESSTLTVGLPGPAFLSKELRV
ncbi:hypothetical protein ARMGADRAFT_1037264 [Armillaria gallica]|uniref:Uncharacterized protein n=1 Tax=Armillaria gallica TaxID=47427 RepID=A0A2H3D734_ARMGA|nr:hypothetical protein ARMGADRAFT_1037264 [Armillaria gallica]